MVGGTTSNTYRKRKESNRNMDRFHNFIRTDTMNIEIEDGGPIFLLQSSNHFDVRFSHIND
jgi:hypothetical protein